MRSVNGKAKFGGRCGHCRCESRGRPRLHGLYIERYSREQGLIVGQAISVVAGDDGAAVGLG